MPEEQRNTRSAIEDPDGHGPRLFFQQVPEDKAAKNRVHLDVRAAPGLRGQERMAALETECDRLVALGATRVRRDEPAPPMSAGFIVMADPEGNEFCLESYDETAAVWASVGQSERLAVLAQSRAVRDE